MVYLTDETFTYVINGVDRDYDNSTPDSNAANLKNIMLSEDFAIKMGSWLDNSVDEYYCEVISYTYNAWNDGSFYTEVKTNMNFTQLFSDLPKTGMASKLQTKKARYPLTQFTSAKTNGLANDDNNGATRNTMNRLQKTTFICENFNATTKYFRMASLRYNAPYDFIDVTSEGLLSYTDADLMIPYSWNLVENGAGDVTAWNQREWLKNYPSVIMYMTPIYKDKIPRELVFNDSFSLVLTSYNRVVGVNGVECELDITPFNSPHKRFKAVFEKLIVKGGLKISQVNRARANFSMHFLCYDWDKSNYGYGGDRLNNGHILTSLPITFNYDNNVNVTPHEFSKLPNENGSIITIDNEKHDRRVKFGFTMSQMQVPKHIEPYGLLTTYPIVQDPLGYFESPWEWILTMRLYGID
jgi:hypothetical protein